MPTLLFFFILTVMTLAAQTIQVSGRVLALDGKPIEGAQIRISAQVRGTPPTQASTDAKGFFSVEDMPAGRYQVNITKPGFIPSNSQTTGAPLEVRLAVASVISGHVTDADGKPVAKAQVNAYRYVYTRGARSLNPAGYSVSTDATGVYTFPALSAGRYYLRVEAALPGVTTYYPSTLDAGAASPVDVEVGAARQGVDIRQVKAPVYSIRGKAVTQSGDPAPNTSLRILAEQAIETQTPPPLTDMGADGSFEFKGLLPGRYVIRAVPNGNARVAGQLVPAKNSARVEAMITRDNIDDFKLVVTEGGYSLAGRIRMEDDSALPIPPAPAVQPPPGAIVMTGLRASLVDAEQTFTQGNLSAAAAPDSGAFRIDSIVPGKYYVTVSPLPANVYIKSVHLRGNDVTRSPVDLMYSGGDDLEIVLGTKAAAVSATVHNSKGEPLPRVQVALWPEKANASNASSSIRVALTDDMGVAHFQGLRPEKYRLAAFADVEQGFVRSPDFLDRFNGRAAELDLVDGAAVERAIEPINREDAAAIIQNLP